MKHEETGAKRLFVALPVTASLHNQLQVFKKNNHAFLKNASWVTENDLHITLRYLGDVSESEIGVICDALSGIKTGKIGIECGGIGFFQTGGKQVFWIDVQSRKKITNLAALVNEKLANLGYEMPNKPYIPHITLCRTDERVNLKKREIWLSKQKSAFKTQWLADRFCLYESGKHETNRYEILSEFFL